MTETPDELPRSPTGRIPKWVLDERQHGTREDTAWRPGSSPAAGGPGPRRPRRGIRFRWLAVAAVLMMAGGLTWQYRHVLGGGSEPAQRAGTRRTQRDLPPAGGDEAGGPLGRPPEVRVPSSSHAFLDTNPDGTPVAYDPCRPIHFVVRPDGAPKGGAALLRSALTRVSRATGLQFVDDGATDEQPRPRREPYQPERYPDRWAPVLIAWQSPGENPDLASDILGQAGSILIGTDGRPAVYVTGQVVLDGPELADVLSRRGGTADARAVILHELAHLVGLDHVDDPAQMMNPVTDGTVDEYAAGDLTGLNALGSGPCAPWL